MGYGEITFEAMTTHLRSNHSKSLHEAESQEDGGQCLLTDLPVVAFLGTLSCFGFTDDILKENVLVNDCSCCEMLF